MAKALTPAQKKAKAKAEREAKIAARNNPVDPSKNPNFRGVDQIAIEQGLGKDELATGDALGRLLFGEGSLGRQTNPYEQAQADQLSRYQGIADQYSNPATRRSADVSDYLNRMRAGLEGYSSPELQGMREQAQKGIDTQAATATAQNQKMQSRAGVRGASAIAQQQNLERSRINAQQDLEQGLFVKNADEKQKRLQTYGAGVQGIEGTEYERMMGANATLSGAQQQAYANNADMQKTNLGQLAAEKAGTAGSLLSGIDMVHQRKEAAKREKIAQEMRDRANSLASKGRSTEATNLQAQIAALYNTGTEA